MPITSRRKIEEKVEKLANKEDVSKLANKEEVKELAEQLKEVKDLLLKLQSRDSHP